MHQWLLLSEISFTPTYNALHASSIKNNFIILLTKTKWYPCYYYFVFFIWNIYKTLLIQPSHIRRPLPFYVFQKTGRIYLVFEVKIVFDFNFNWWRSFTPHFRRIINKRNANKNPKGIFCFFLRDPFKKTFNFIPVSSRYLTHP